MRSLIVIVPAILSLALVACAADNDSHSAPVKPEHVTQPQTLAKEGDACHVSSECDEGLECDLGSDVHTKGLPVNTDDSNNVDAGPAPAPAPNPGGFGTCEKHVRLPAGSSCITTDDCEAGLSCKPSTIGTRGLPPAPTPDPAPAPAPASNVCSH